MVCGGCENWGFFAAGFCAPCLKRYLGFRLPDEDAILANALFLYDEPIRTFILRAKINHDIACIRFLRACFVRSPITRRLAATCDTVMPAASSLWSRFYGRFDLAYELAFAISQRYGLAIKPCPRTFGWQIRKQAHRSWRRRTWSGPLVTDPSAKILLIDDIRTSGQTLNQLRMSIKAQQIRTLTLARNRPKS